jgi:hypothetical protein
MSSNALRAIVCGRGKKRFDRERVQKTMLSLSRAFLFWRSELDPTAENWWNRDRHIFRVLVRAGVIEELFPQQGEPATSGGKEKNHERN